MVTGALHVGWLIMETAWARRWPVAATQKPKYPRRSLRSYDLLQYSAFYLRSDSKIILAVKVYLTLFKRG